MLKHDFCHKTTPTGWGYPVGVVWVVFLFLCLPVKTQEIETPKLNSLKYLDIGLGAGLPDDFGVANVGLSLDATDMLAVFIEYNMFFNKYVIYLHETNIKIGPYFRFSPFIYTALSTGFSFMFNPSRRRNPQDINDSDNYLYTIPIQLRFNFGMNDWLSLGVKGTYNMVLNDQGRDKGSVVVFVGYKFRD